MKAQPRDQILRNAQTSTQIERGRDSRHKTSTPTTWRATYRLDDVLEYELHSDGAAWWIVSPYTSNTFALAGCDETAARIAWGEIIRTAGACCHQCGIPTALLPREHVTSLTGVDGQTSPMCLPCIKTLIGFCQSVETWFSRALPGQEG